MLTFEARDLTIEVEAEPAGDDDAAPRRPARAAAARRRSPFATATSWSPTRADERGRFVAGGVDPGPVSLRCRLDGESGEGRLVETAWLSI